MSKSGCFLVCMIVGVLVLPNIIASEEEEEEEDEAKFYEVKQGNLSVRFTNLGARIVSLSFPDKHGLIIKYRSSSVTFSRNSYYVS